MQWWMTQLAIELEKTKCEFILQVSAPNLWALIIGKETTMFDWAAFEGDVDPSAFTNKRYIVKFEMQYDKSIPE